MGKAKMLLQHYYWLKIKMWKLCLYSPFWTVVWTRHHTLPTLLPTQPWVKGHTEYWLYVILPFTKSLHCWVTVVWWVCPRCPGGCGIQMLHCTITSSCDITHYHEYLL